MFCTGPGIRLLVLAAFLSAAGICAAQQPKQGRGRPMMGAGMGAMGGMGAGAQSSSALWGTLLRLESVQKELGLSDEQKNKLKEIGEKAMARFREGMPSRESFRDLSEEQRQARAAEMRKKMETQMEALKKDIEGVLLPRQVERLNQIVLQVRGAQALEDKDVQQALGLSDAQKEKLKGVREKMAGKYREIVSKARGEGGWQGLREKMQPLQKEAQEEALTVLTAEQKEKFEKLKGPKFEVDLAQALRRSQGPGRGAAPQK